MLIFQMKRLQLFVTFSWSEMFSVFAESRESQLDSKLNLLIRQPWSNFMLFNISMLFHKVLKQRRSAGLEIKSCFTSCTRLTCLFRLLAESSSLKCGFSDFSRRSNSYRQMLHLDRRGLALVFSPSRSSPAPTSSSVSTSAPWTSSEAPSSKLSSGSISEVWNASILGHQKSVLDSDLWDYSRIFFLSGLDHFENVWLDRPDRTGNKSTAMQC